MMGTQGEEVREEVPARRTPQSAAGPEDPASQPTGTCEGAITGGHRPGAAEDTPEHRGLQKTWERVGHQVRAPRPQD